MQGSCVHRRIPGGGESLQELDDRIAAALLDIAASHPGAAAVMFVGVFCHKFVAYDANAAGSAAYAAASLGVARACRSCMFTLQQRCWTLRHLTQVQQLLCLLVCYVISLLPTMQMQQGQLRTQPHPLGWQELAGAVCSHRSSTAEHFCSTPRWCSRLCAWWLHC
jgi:hypothetical protein